MLAEISLPQRMSRSSFDAGEILHREGDPVQEKCRVCCRVSYRVPADEAIEAGPATLMETAPL